ncbi:hypothetical protein [Bacteriovorax sp. Seq25_V]|uniref:hypothetical protein n=1 Tax=Bacteriovorax sp. Seq25_V TaxID=1201288 RepID=UPI00038A4367|nr:hypothetical protein [Bacteriovorax sp. Seq25_V]EQC46065.1 hypothetical protein M900_1591 [Bacteriovorax sp. Seq25_V]
MKYILAFLLLSLNIFAFEYQDTFEQFKTQKYMVRTLDHLYDLKGFYQSPYREYELVDQVFENDDGKRVFVKVGLEFPRAYNKVIRPKDGGYLYHEMMEKVPVAMLFHNIERKDIDKYVMRLRAKVSTSKFTFKNPLFQNAYASTCGVEIAAMSSAQLASLSQIGNKVETEFLMENAKSCLSEALSGAWQATGGLVASAASGFMSFIKNPVKAANKFWDSAVSTFEKTKEFVMNIKSSLKEVGEVIAGMPAEQKAMIVCNLVGSIGTTALVGILTGGPAGLARALTTLASKISLIKGVKSALGVLSKLKIPRDEMNGLFSKIMKSDNKKGLDDLEFMAGHGMEKLTLEVATCAL